MGKTYKSGQHFNKGDNCNTCLCANTGDVRCTELICPAGKVLYIILKRGIVIHKLGYISNVVNLVSQTNLKYHEIT